MKQNKVTNFLKKAEEFGKKNSASFLCGTGIVGVLATGWTAYIAGMRSKEIVDRYRTEIDPIYDEALEKTENEEERALYVKKEKNELRKFYAKELAPIVAPPIIMGAATIACIGGSHSISSRRIAALSAAYSISETAVKELNGKMQEVLGEKKTKAIKDAITKDHLDKHPVPSDDQIVFTGNGDVLCYDSYTGRYFYSNAQKIQQAINKVSHYLILDMYVSLNEFYDSIGLHQVPMGNDLGWNVDDCINAQVPITLTAILTDTQVPCLCIDYDISLRADFRNLH